MDKYCVFGNPISHSRSPIIHQIFAEQTNQALTYTTQLAPKDGFAQAVNDFITAGGKGANVTLPFKEQALHLCDQLSEAAEQACAVNTLSFINDKIVGDNTDGFGLVQDLLRNKLTLKGSRILLLGAGGAAKGIILPLLAQNPESITIANRTISKAEQLYKQFNDEKIQACGFEQIPLLPFDIIINATSASLSGTFPEISADLIINTTACYDMVYGKELTPFLLWAQQQGAAKVIDGLGMLVGQAAVSFKIWRNIMPEIYPVIKQLKEKLETEKT